MKNSYEQRVQNQFGGFCTRVLKNEAKRILNEYTRQRDREKSLDDLSPDELAQASSYDKYFQDEYVFEVLGRKVFVVGNLLADAITQLAEDKQDIILLSYFLGMTDREISEQLNVVRQAVSKRRANILKELREYLEKEGFEWPEI
ncbi:TPA: RNA polymerase sigma factor [Clostridioides difficile]